MELKQLLASGGLVPSKIIKKEITIRRPVQTPAADWSDPEVPEYSEDVSEDKVTVNIRTAWAADEIEVLRASNREAPFVAIHRYVVNEDGTPLFESLEQAMSLASWLAIPMFNAIGEVNGSRPKASRRRTSSGSKSRSPSVAEARKSGSTPSAPNG